MQAPVQQLPIAQPQEVVRAPITQPTSTPQAKGIILEQLRP
jgi:hypothetical protein